MILKFWLIGISVLTLFAQSLSLRMTPTFELQFAARDADIPETAFLLILHPGGEMTGLQAREISEEDFTGILSGLDGRKRCQIKLVVGRGTSPLTVARILGNMQAVANPNVTTTIFIQFDVPLEE